MSRVGLTLGLSRLVIALACGIALTRGRTRFMSPVGLMLGLSRLVIALACGVALTRGRTRFMSPVGLTRSGRNPKVRVVGS
jgi:hypothetical protein